MFIILVDVTFLSYLIWSKFCSHLCLRLFFFKLNWIIYQKKSHHYLFIFFIVEAYYSVSFLLLTSPLAIDNLSQNNKNNINNLSLFSFSKISCLSSLMIQSLCCYQHLCLLSTMITPVWQPFNSHHKCHKRCYLLSLVTICWHCSIVSNSTWEGNILNIYFIKK